MVRVRRRSVLIGAAGAVGAVALEGIAAPAGAARPADEPQDVEIPPPLPRAVNGWPMLDVADAALRQDSIPSWPVPGTGQSVLLCAGAPAALLVYVARRYHYEIGSLEASRGSALIAGYAPRTGREPAAAAATVRAAGTSVHLRSDWYPAGTSGGYTDRELTVLRDVLARCEGAVRWGGDSPAELDESRFEIAVGPEDERLEAALAALQVDESRHRGPGAGAARLVDEPSRRRAALELAHRQQVQDAEDGVPDARHS